MSEDAIKSAGPGSDTGPARDMTSKVRAWIDEARFERSLSGPGAHRQAYRRLLEHGGELSAARPITGLAPLPRADASDEPPASPPLEDEDTAPQAPQRSRSRREARQRGAAKHPASIPARGRTLFAASALAVVFAAAPLGYLVFDLVDNQPALVSEQALRQAKAIDQPAPAPLPEPAVARAVATVHVEPAAAEAREPLAVTDVAKAEADAPFKSLEEAATFSSEEPATVQTASIARPEPVAAVAEEQPKQSLASPPQRQTATERQEPLQVEAQAPRPDPRAEHLMRQGEKLAELGEVAMARTFFERAAERGAVQALLRLAQTYDPIALKEMKVVGITPAPAKAIELYNKARGTGNSDAAKGLTGLSAWLSR